jgi:acyl-coenzyme A synthetase/AMP-(fatty) acid ligase
MKMLPDSIGNQNTALIFDDQRYSFFELKIQVQYWHHTLESTFLKLKFQDLILIYLDNSSDFVALFYAITSYKGIFFPIDPSMPEHVLQDTLKKNHVRYVLTQKKYASRFKKTNLKINVMIIDNGQNDDSAFLENKPKERALKEYVIAQLTSGSTGQVKLIKRTYFDILIEAKNVSNRLKLKKNKLLFCPLKLSHSYALTTCLTSTLYAGATFISLKTFLPYHLGVALKKNPTILAGTPYIYESLLTLMKKRDLGLDGINVFMSAGEATSKALFEMFFSKTKKTIIGLYGMTETGAISINYPFNKKYTLSVGKPFKHIQVGIGEKEKMIIYKKGQKKFASNDRGRLHPDGRITILERLDRRIDLNGKKLSPEFIEKIMLKHSNIKNVSVTKIVIQGKALLKAEIILRRKTSRKSIYEFCVAALPAFMIPHFIEFKKAIPRKTLL